MEAKTLNRPESRDEKNSTVIGALLLLGLFVPHNGITLALNPLLVCYCIYISRERRCYFPLKWIGAILIAISGLIYILGSTDWSIKELARSVTLMMMIAAFPFFRVDAKITKRLLYAAIAYILLSQFVYYVGIGFMIDFYEAVYVYEGESKILTQEYLRENARAVSLGGYGSRLGGLFHNPNQCSKYVSLLFVLFVIEREDSTLHSVLPYFGLTMISVLFTGSRTGLVVCVVVFIIVVIKSYRLGITRLEFLLSLVLIISAAVWIWLEASIGTEEQIRALALEQGVKTSIGAKWHMLANYFNQQESGILILFGCFDISLVAVQVRSDLIVMDSEWGNMMFAYGLAFTLTIGIMYVAVYRQLESEYRVYYLFFLWMVSSTVLFSYRTSFLFMLFLSKFYYQSTIRNGSKTEEAECG